MTVAIIDADPIVYACGFAGEHHTYYLTVKGEHGPRATFDYKTEMKRWATEAGLDEDQWDYEDMLDVEPLANVLSTAKKRLHSIIDNTGATSTRLFLTGGKQFRKEIYPEYKANRPSTKPFYYKEIREYLIDTWEAEVIDVFEADDACATLQVALKGKSVICTIDKDLLQVPGRHYNYDTGEEHFVNNFGHIEINFARKVVKGWGRKFFYAQMLMGDATDNIKGIPKVGPATAFDIMEPINAEQEARDAVLAAYNKHYGEEKGLEMLTLNRKLLWMYRDVPLEI